MNYVLIPGALFVVIEYVATSQGLSAFATIAGAGALMCVGMWVGWQAWERSRRKAKHRKG